MRGFKILIIASLCAIAATPARAVEELQDCDAVKDTANRMACLQAHIAHLEQTLLSLNTELVDIKHNLKAKLAADEVYKLQYVGKGSCLGFADNDKPPAFGSCDRPDSWKLLRGSQLPSKTSTAPKQTTAPTQGGQASNPAPGQGSHEPKAQGQSADQSQGKANLQPQAEQGPRSQGKSSSQPMSAPQSN